tara:strand:+ start:3829 stop:4065 length:237 start_codon:yes stop_codon:yes gene_type:complete
LSSLEEYASSQPTRRSTAWREQNESNRAAWIEACEGVKLKGVPAQTAAKWLIEEKNCPLSIDSIRTALRNTMEQYVKS